MATEVDLDAWRTCHVTHDHPLVTEFARNLVLSVTKEKFPTRATSAAEATEEQAAKRPPPDQRWLQLRAKRICPSQQSIVNPNQSTALMQATQYINEQFFQSKPIPTPVVFAHQNRIRLLPDYVEIQWYLWIDDIPQAEHALERARKKAVPPAKPSPAEELDETLVRAAQLATRSKPPKPVIPARSQVFPRRNLKAPGKSATKANPRVVVKRTALRTTMVAPRKKVEVASKARAPKPKPTTLRPILPKPAARVANIIIESDDDMPRRTPKGKRKREDDDEDWVDEGSPIVKKSKTADPFTPRRGRGRPRKSDTALGVVNEDDGAQADGSPAYTSPRKGYKSRPAQIIEKRRKQKQQQEQQSSTLQDDPFIAGSSPPSSVDSAFLSQLRSSRISSIRDRLTLGPDTRPLVPVRPPVWTFGRQALCESLPYFRATEAGLYSKGKKAKGYLIDGCPSERDAWASDGRVIISHGGGHADTDADGNIKLIEDQSEEDSRIQALLHTMEEKDPVALILGSKSQLPPFRIECHYAVLGYYIITHHWVELEGPEKNRRFKFRFEWLPSQGEPWWLGADKIPGGWEPKVKERKDLEKKGQKEPPSVQMPVEEHNEQPEKTAPPNHSAMSSFVDSEERDRLLDNLAPFDDTDSLGVPTPRPAVSTEDDHIETSSGLMRDDVNAAYMSELQEELDGLPLSETALPQDMTNAALEGVPSILATIPPAVCSSNSESIRAPAMPTMTLASPGPDHQSSIEVETISSVGTSSERESTTRLDSSTDIEEESLPTHSVVRAAINHDDLERMLGRPRNPEINDARRVGPLPSFSCTACGWESCVVYSIGKICLNTKCRQRFWKIRIDDRVYMSIPHDLELDFHPGFLKCASMTGEWTLPPLAPDPPMSDEELEEGVRMNRTAWQGWHCRDCGRLNQRLSLRGWCCKECGKTLMPKPSRLTVDAVKGTVNPIMPPSFGTVDVDKVIEHHQYKTSDKRFLVTRFELPDCESNIYHLRPQKFQGELNPADDLFHQLLAETQAYDLLHRFPAQHSTLRGEAYSQHFLCNAGTHYKYITNISTTPFEKCPPSMLEARRIVYERAMEVINDDPKFNEMLTVAYMDEQHMAYHDDGEPGLGPTVASMSLGAPAYMAFKRKNPKPSRMLDDGEGTDSDEESAWEVQEEEGRVDREYDDDLGEENDDDNDDLEDYEDEVDPDEIDEDTVIVPPDIEDDDGVVRAKKANSKACLSLALTHGDILVMQGRKLQDMYVHKVDPKGFRFACTSRYIADVNKHGG